MAESIKLSELSGRRLQYAKAADINDNGKLEGAELSVFGSMLQDATEEGLDLNAEAKQGQPSGSEKEMSKLEAAELIKKNFEKVNVDKEDGISKEDIKNAYSTASGELKKALEVFINDSSFFDEVDGMTTKNGSISENNLNKYTDLTSAEVLKNHIADLDQAAGIGEKDNMFSFADLEKVNTKDDSEFKAAVEHFKNDKEKFKELETATEGYKSDDIASIDDLENYIAKKEKPANEEPPADTEKEMSKLEAATIIKANISKIDSNKNNAIDHKEITAAQETASGELKKALELFINDSSFFDEVDGMTTKNGSISENNLNKYTDLTSAKVLKNHIADLDQAAGIGEKDNKFSFEDLTKVDTKGNKEFEAAIKHFKNDRAAFKILETSMDNDLSKADDVVALGDLEKYIAKNEKPASAPPQQGTEITSATQALQIIIENFNDLNSDKKEVNDVTHDVQWTEGDHIKIETLANSTDPKVKAAYEYLKNNGLLDALDKYGGYDSNGKEINGYKELDGQFRLDQAQRMQKYYAEEEKETLDKRTNEKNELVKEITASQTKIDNLKALLEKFENYNTDSLEVNEVTHKETWTEGEHIEFKTLADVAEAVIKTAYEYLKDNGLIDVLDKYAGYDSSNNKINGYKETDGQFRKDQLQRMIDDETANLKKLNEDLKKYSDIKES